MTIEPPEPVPAVTPLPPITAEDNSLFVSPPPLATAATAATAVVATVPPAAAAVATTTSGSSGCSLLWLLMMILALALLIAAVILPALGMPIVVTDWWAAMTKYWRTTFTTKKDDVDDDEEEGEEKEVVLRSGSARDARPVDAAASMDITGSSLTPSFVDPRRGSMSREAMRSSSIGDAAMTRELQRVHGGGTWSPSVMSTAAGGGARTQAGTSGFTGLMHSGRDAVRAPPQRPAFFSWQAK